MSDLLGNLWIDYAMHNMQMAASANNNGDYSRSQMLSHEASTNATLALAYEQRTANLIAVATAVSENGVYQLDPALVGAVQEELAERLGLGGREIGGRGERELS